MNDPHVDHCPLRAGAVTRIAGHPSHAITSGRRVTDGRRSASAMTNHTNIGDGKYERAAGPMDAPKIIDRGHPMTTDERFQRLRGALKDAGYRSTASRDRLLRTFVSCGTPVSAQDLCRLGGGQANAVTTYRLLANLFTLGLVIRSVRLNNTFVFALHGEGDSHIHYLVCDRCGHLEPFHGCVVSEWLKMTPTPRGFRVEYHLFTLYGTCRACR
ncbi:MAG: transcriptional repressor [Fibrella sp.]|nr:transcriptional repressor [Armatimonadota bacterium]